MLANTCNVRFLSAAFSDETRENIIIEKTFCSKLEKGKKLFNEVFKCPFKNPSHADLMNNERMRFKSEFFVPLRLK